MRVGAIKEGLSRQIGGPPRDAFSPADDRAQSRALVVVEAAAAHELPAVPRQAAFLAQLIATKGQLPQTRARRRAEPNEVLAAYRATVALTRWR
jgi:hypothetical protein